LSVPSVGEGARSKAPPKAMNRVWEPIELIPAAPGTLGVFPQAIHLPIITGLPRIPGVVHRSKFLCNQVWPGHPGVRSTAFRRIRPVRLLPSIVGKRKKTCSTRVNAVLQTPAAARTVMHPRHGERSAFRRIRPVRLVPSIVEKRKKTCSTRANAVLQAAAVAPARTVITRGMGRSAGRADVV